MTVLAMLLRAVWRHQVRSLAVLAVVSGVGLGVVITAVAAARRANDAYSVLRADTLAPDVGGDGNVSDDDVARLAAAPEVAAIARFAYVPVAPAALAGQTPGFVSPDPDFLHTVYRPQVRAGRLPRRGVADEVVVNEQMAAMGGFEPGDRVPLRYGNEVSVDLGEVTIVGITRGTFDVGQLNKTGAMYLPSEFFDAHPDLELGEPNLLVRLANGDDDFATFRQT
jgi:hypothetical protein